MRKYKCYSMMFIASLFVVLIAGCNRPTIPDITAPTVSFVNPVNLATDVPINRKITVTFSEAMDPCTITKATFTIEEGSTPVTGRVVYIGTTAIFTPDVDLADNTVYNATITTDARDLAGNALESTYVWSFTTGTDPDTTAPTVSFVNPVNLATEVPINMKIAATFSEAMDPMTITKSTFTLKKGTVPVTGTVTYTDTIATDVSTQCLNLFNVWGTVAYTGTTAIFTPTNGLETNTVYTATITTDAKDLAGNALENTYIWSFTTGTMSDAVSPTVSSTDPANGETNVAINKKIAATFSEAMDPLTITTATFTMKQGTTPVTGTVTYTGITATFTPSSDLAYNTVYTATITIEANDLADNALENTYVWSFKTGNIPDTTPPTVTGTIHANGATNVAINTKVGATFSEGMDPLTITNLTFTLEAPVGTPVLGMVSYSGVNAVFIPLSNLAPNTLYTVTIKGGVSGAKDLAGNPLASDYVWSWTTGAAPDIIPPTVSSTNPADLAVGICINKTINATLSEPMDLLTITTATFTLAVTAGASVDGVVAYDALTNIATFDPTLNLTATTNYTATIKGGVSGAKDLAGNPLASDFVWTFTTGTTDCQTSVPLGAASTFAILAEAAITINPPSAVTGDVGTNPAAGSLITGSGICDPGTVTGTIYAIDATGPACAVNVGPVPNIISAAQTAALAAYLDAVAAPRGTPVAITTDLEGLTFYPGLYESGTSIDLSKTSAVGGKLYLDAQGDVNAVFIIRSATTIITISGTEVVLTNGAQAKNVFWVAGSAVTLGTTSIMKGTLIASTALTLNIGSNLEGRALNQGAAATAITCDQCTITVPSP